ncbi:hypothetical protein O5D80_002762 [Batrachochytrium dendrobatidis]|nr:hypothetical protein O5D80_002762 [Batrachochytrium dendrobatidis]
MQFTLPASILGLHTWGAICLIAILSMMAITVLVIAFKWCVSKRQSMLSTKAVLSNKLTTPATVRSSSMAAAEMVKRRGETMPRDIETGQRSMARAKLVDNTKRYALTAVPVPNQFEPSSPSQTIKKSPQACPPQSETYPVRGPTQPTEINGASNSLSERSAIQCSSTQESCSYSNKCSTLNRNTEGILKASFDNQTLATLSRLIRSNTIRSKASSHNELMISLSRTISQKATLRSSNGYSPSMLNSTTSIPNPHEFHPEATLMAAGVIDSNDLSPNDSPNSFECNPISTNLYDTNGSVSAAAESLTVSIKDNLDMESVSSNSFGSIQSHDVSLAPLYGQVNPQARLPILTQDTRPESEIPLYHPQAQKRLDLIKHLADRTSKAIDFRTSISSSADGEQDIMDVLTAHRQFDQADGIDLGSGVGASLFPNGLNGTMKTPTTDRTACTTPSTIGSGGTHSRLGTITSDVHASPATPMSSVIRIEEQPFGDIVTQTVLSDKLISNSAKELFLEMSASGSNSGTIHSTKSSRGVAPVPAKAKNVHLLKLFKKVHGQTKNLHGSSSMSELDWEAELKDSGPNSIPCKAETLQRCVNATGNTLKAKSKIQHNLAFSGVENDNYMLTRSNSDGQIRSLKSKLDGSLLSDATPRASSKYNTEYQIDKNCATTKGPIGFLHATETEPKASILQVMKSQSNRHTTKQLLPNLQQEPINMNKKEKRRYLEKECEYSMSNKSTTSELSSEDDVPLAILERSYSKNAAFNQDKQGSLSPKRIIKNNGIVVHDSAIALVE